MPGPPLAPGSLLPFERLLPLIDAFCGAAPVQRGGPMRVARRSIGGWRGSAKLRSAPRCWPDTVTQASATCSSVEANL